MASPLLVTKFHIPSARSTWVKRDRLIGLLNQSLDHKLTLVSAPAGFGKTTLLGDWAHQVSIPVNWLSLDERDNDPIQFWTYVIGALQQTHCEVGEATLAMLRSTEIIPFESFLIPLINEIANAKGNIVLILDDYHVITVDAIHQAVTFLLEHLPSQLHLIFASRVDPAVPLAQLRAHSQLLELRSSDLRFTLTEAALFLNNMRQLALSQSQVEAIQARTEGWIAGLQLAALSMQDAEDRIAFIDSFQGTHRYILDYLTEEVLDRQPKPLQTFLLRTAILKQMCGSLCEVVVGDNTGDGSLILEQLERQNLFVVSLDRDRTWYRYHHLFRELLLHRLHRLEPDHIPQYHRRAAQWYEQNGWVIEAIQHYIAAQDFDQAINLIEQEIQLSNPRIESGALLLTCVEALPSEFVWTRPWLLLAYAWGLYSTSQFETAVKAVQDIERLLQQSNTVPANLEKLWGLVTAFKGMQARQQGATAEAVMFMERALQQLPPDDSWLRLVILLNLGVTYFVADDFASAKTLLPEVARIGQARGLADPAIAGLYLQAQFLALRGRIDDAIALCQQGYELAKKRGWLATYAGVLVQVALADLLREQNQLEEAAQHLTESLDRGIQNRQPGIMMGYITLARVRQAQGDTKAAWEAIRAAEQCPTWLWATILSAPACKARLQLAQGDVEGAIAWVEASDLSIEDELQYSFTDQHPYGSELDYLTLARVLIARGRVSSPSYLDDAIVLLNRLHDFAKTGGRTARVMEVLILQALVWQARGDYNRALDMLQRSLELPRSGDDIRLFVDEGKPMQELLHQAAVRKINTQTVNRLLEAFGPSRKQDQPLIEPLTQRELEVLGYLAQGLSDQAIADQLYVSLAAVKWHDRNIYSKLSVSNRTQAVARARELKILV